MASITAAVAALILSAARGWTALQQTPACESPRPPEESGVVSIARDGAPRHQKNVQGPLVAVSICLEVTLRLLWKCFVKWDSGLGKTQSAGDRARSSIERTPPVKADERWL